MLHTNKRIRREVAVARKFGRLLRNVYPPSDATLIKNALKLQSAE